MNGSFASHANNSANQTHVVSDLLGYLTRCGQGNYLITSRTTESAFSQSTDTSGGSYPRLIRRDVVHDIWDSRIVRRDWRTAHDLTVWLPYSCVQYLLTIFSGVITNHDM